ncbi:YtxH domain-containing protein [Cohnella terricola]|uniref:YtxH domain-containing protein n=1 Tax=Cohnella terricola TaxID=1289167 RepID=A0A559JKK8_9BACL|nr:YtxH domain-containing protein [Cohnella terricola]TVY00413.1 YtxH domain-containing protein [Cohnella terricola]
MPNKKTVATFLLGTVTGGVTALLLAPKSGRELRGDISETAHKVGEKTTHISRQASAAVQSFAKRAAELFADARAAADEDVVDVQTSVNADFVDAIVVTEDESEEAADVV